MKDDNAPILMRLLCPICGELHIDEGEFATKLHHTHACQACGHVWRPAIVNTVGVKFLPGFTNESRIDETLTVTRAKELARMYRAAHSDAWRSRDATETATTLFLNSAIDVAIILDRYVSLINARGQK